MIITMSKSKSRALLAEAAVNDRVMARWAVWRAALAVAAFAAGCAGEPRPNQNIETKVFSAELPSDWSVSYHKNGPAVAAIQREQFKQSFPSLTIWVTDDSSPSRCESIDGKPPVAPLTRRTVANRDAYEGSATYSNTLEISIAAKLDAESGRTVEREVVPMRETRVCVAAPFGGLDIGFIAPLALYDKHRPALDHLLATLKFEP